MTLRRTKIVATLGPASDSPEMIAALFQEAGLPDGLRQAEQRLAGTDIAVLADVIDRGNRGIETDLPPLRVVPVARQHDSHPFRPTRDRGHPGS